MDTVVLVSNMFQVIGYEFDKDRPEREKRDNC